MLSPAQLEQLSTQIEKAKKLLDEGNVPQALSAATRCASTGSFAEPAVTAGELLKRISADGEAAVQRATGSLEKNDSPDAQLEALVLLVETSRLYARVPVVAKAAHVALRDFRKDKDGRDTVKQAELIDGAKDLERKSQPARAITKYRQIAKDYPDTAAAKLAQARIEELEKGAAGTATLASGEETTASTSTSDSAGSKSAASKSTATKSTAATPVVDEKRAGSLLRMAASLADAKPAKAREYAEKALALAPAGSAVAKQAAELIKTLE